MGDTTHPYLALTAAGPAAYSLVVSYKTAPLLIAVLLATGASYRRLDVPGEDDYIGAGVHFCTTCDGPFYKGAKEIAVIGGGNSAVEEGLHLTNFAEKVTMLVRGDRLRASQIAIDKVHEPTSAQYILPEPPRGTRPIRFPADRS